MLMGWMPIWLTSGGQSYFLVIDHNCQPCPSPRILWLAVGRLNVVYSYLCKVTRKANVSWDLWNFCTNKIWVEAWFGTNFQYCNDSQNSLVAGDYWSSVNTVTQLLYLTKPSNFWGGCVWCVIVSDNTIWVELPFIFMLIKDIISTRC